ncbi:hypothetical protein [Photobacterium profundum]|nr:hypothetical protein [Photobacterium profundum]
MMKIIMFATFIMAVSVSSCANEFNLGDSRNKMIRMQTVDPLAENKVPVGSPPYSGKKASKAIASGNEGKEGKDLKNKTLIDES